MVFCVFESISCYSSYQSSWKFNGMLYLYLVFDFTYSTFQVCMLTYFDLLPNSLHTTQLHVWIVLIVVIYIFRRIRWKIRNGWRRHRRRFVRWPPQLQILQFSSSPQGRMCDKLVWNYSIWGIKFVIAIHHLLQN